MVNSGVKLDGIDRGIAIFLLVFAIGFLLVGAVVMVLFWRERNAFEIKQRSAYLVMLTGVSFLAVICKIMVNQVEGVFGYHKNVFIAKTVKYFAIVCSTCCYGSRTIRLWVRYKDWARQAFRWLKPERPHVVACLLLGVAAMIYPLDYMATHGNSDSTEDEFVEKADDQLWIISLIAKVIVIALNPLTWAVDDIFNLERELRVMVVVLLVQIAGGKAVEDSPLRVTRWVDDENLDFAGAVIMFSLSVILPIKERLLHPMQSSDPKEIAALQKRKGKGLGRRGMGKQGHPFSLLKTNRRTWFRKDSDGCASVSGRVDDDDANTVGFASANNSPGAWTYERVMSTPEISAAFMDFSRKALCQESFFFLKDAMTYQTEYFTDVQDGEGKDEDGGSGGGGGSEASHRGREVRGGADEERFAFLTKIVRDYINDGASNEINISSRDRRNILDIYKLGKGGFRELPTEEKRSVLAKAYSEIRFMLESNLMRKFLSTDGFKEAEAADRAKDTYSQHA